MKNIWNELSDESKEWIRQKYATIRYNSVDDGTLDSYIEAAEVLVYYDLFGRENLNLE